MKKSIFLRGKMLKRIFLLVLATVLFTFELSVSSAAALELSEDVRTVKLNEQGEETVIGLKEYKVGEKIFVDTCSQCHNAGRTKTNPNVTLSSSDLKIAFPPRDNIEEMVSYLKEPYSYDGEIDISLLHPNTSRSDIFAEMRNLNEDDLEAVSGYILIQPAVRGDEFWGGGKVFN